MRKYLLIASLIFSFILLSGCANKNIINPNGKNSGSNITPPAKKTFTVKDYYSFKKNTKYTYEGNGNEYASYNVFVDYINGDLVQLRVNNGGTEMVKVFENKNEEITMRLSRAECYYREDLTKIPSSKPEIILKEPLKKGTNWTLADGRKRYISNEDVQITTPSGNYKALEVTTESKEDKTLDYYAPNIGLVKTVFKFKDFEVSSTLSKIENGIPLTQRVKFYYPNVNEDKIYFTEKQLSFNTNDITRAIFEKAYKVIPKEGISKVLSPNVKINSLYLNKDNKVYIDFSKELVSEMNAGSGYESMILQSITNTFGTYYGVDKVYITIEGSPYSSGHILMKKGEAFTVNFKNSFQLK